MIRDYVQEVFEPTLLYGVLAGAVGILAAHHFAPSGLTLWYGIIAIIGVVLSQIAVNLIDDYFDFRTGLDKATNKSKFGGGKLTKDTVNPTVVLTVAIISLLVGLSIGAFLLYAVGTIILVPMIFGLITVVFYPRFLTHIPFLAEPLCAASFAIVALATFVVVLGAGHALPLLWTASLVFVPAGLQAGAALTINEMPDRIPDRKFGRRSGVVMVGTNVGVTLMYLLIYILSYGLLLYGVVSNALPTSFLLMFVMLLPNYLILKGILGYKDAGKHRKTIALSALTTLVYMLLLALLFLA